MEFASDVGLEFDDGQNTFRIGPKWADLQIGDTLALHELGKGKIGEAVVVGVVTGPYWQLLRRHCVNNHGVTVLDKRTAVEIVDSILRPLYPQLEEDTLAVAVYLRRTS